MGGLEEFKKQREQALPNSQKANGAENGAEDAVTPEKNATPATSLNTAPPVSPEPQTELGLGEPPEPVAEPVVGDNWADHPTEVQLKQWWAEFVETQPVRISSLLKTTTPKIEHDEVVIVMPPSRIEPLEIVKFPFNRFIQDISEGRLKRLRIDAGEVEQMERKPYTEKEKLEYLQKMNPILKDVIDKLDLKLP